jgi:hypothetical protein
MARLLGRRGGRRRAQRLSARERKRIAALGGNARGVSLQIAQRIEENFRYFAAARELRGPASPVLRRTTFEGPLPGIYSATTPVKP